MSDSSFKTEITIYIEGLDDGTARVRATSIDDSNESYRGYIKDLTDATVKSWRGGERRELPVVQRLREIVSGYNNTKFVSSAGGLSRRINAVVSESKAPKEAQTILETRFVGGVSDVSS
jgi:hypothetical protein